MVEQKIHSHWITSSAREGRTGSSEARFPYWSFTKTAIAICTLKLAEIGVLNLDAQVSGQPYSLRHLLAHTSGLPDYSQLEAYHAAVTAKDAPWSRETLLGMAMGKDLLFEPGNGWSYSNIGYMFIREQIEQVTGKPLGSIISDIICKPLGLRSIELSESREHFAKLHWNAATDYDPGWVYHGCLTGTVSDASRLLQALFAGDLLRSVTLYQMLVSRPLGGPVPDRPWMQCGYALGLMSGLMEGVGVAIGHSGSGPSSANAVYHFPDAPEPITVACFAGGSNEGIAEFAAAKIAQPQ